MIDYKESRENISDNPNTKNFVIYKNANFQYLLENKYIDQLFPINDKMNLEIEENNSTNSDSKKVNFIKIFYFLIFLNLFYIYSLI
jgi:hypothetical protein